MSDQIPPQKRAYRKAKPGIAYTLDLPHGHVLEVKASANAWWMRPITLSNLIAAFSANCTIEEACEYAKISLKQFKYFVSLHPEFRELRSSLSQELSIEAKLTLARELHKGDDPYLALRYLTKKEPRTFARRSGPNENEFEEDPEENHPVWAEAWKEENLPPEQWT